MELTVMQMYWLLKLDDIINFLIGTGIVSIGVLAICLIFGPLVIHEIFNSPPWLKIRNAAIILISYIFIVFLCATFIPTTKQLAAIMVVPKIANNEQVQQIPEKILNLGLEWLNELKPEKEKD